ncbi:MAG: TetR/AcrR family transcriptional regulator [Firmicutes bacterium]|uniref:TetR/AcrR family transcriptional regulator n=1 Tax=Candidatus Gallilactobacillus intestinavium TaxID=2840838 RepID=A0A9D9E819_9LACO|nr:TetR/AcrR family transcriptional regulator [Candidatus Gallilactobacillus intestinavium]
MTKENKSKQKIINIATKMFAEKGVDKVSVRDILREINGASGMFYYYFKSKEDLYKATVQQFIDKTISKKRQIIFDDDLSLREKLYFIYKAVIKDYEQFSKNYILKDEFNFNKESYFLPIFYKMLETLSLDLKVMFNKAIDNNEINLDMSVDTFVDFMTYGIWGVLYNNLSILSEDNIKKNEEKVKKIFTLVFSLLNDENHSI